jgi:hypothetical protein
MAKWYETHTIAVDSLKGGQHEHGGFDVGLKNSCECEPIQTSLAAGEREPGPRNRPLIRPPAMLPLVRTVEEIIHAALRSGVDHCPFARQEAGP